MAEVTWTELCVDFWSANYKGQWLTVRRTKSGRQWQARVNGQTFTHHERADQARSAAEIFAGYLRRNQRANHSSTTGEKS